MSKNDITFADREKALKITSAQAYEFDMTEKIELDHGILFECLESICYLNIHYAEDYCETISVNKAKKIIEFLNKFVQAKERK